jgi:hypothetical protein
MLKSKKELHDFLDNLWNICLFCQTKQNMKRTLW